MLEDFLYLYKGSCNTYVFLADSTAVVIDPGNGEIFGILSAMGITQVDMVIVTSHKRALSAGVCKAIEHYPKTMIYAPEEERAIFANNDDYWQEKRIFTQFNLDSSFDAPVQGIPAKNIATTIPDWNGIIFRVLSTPGVTKGAISISCKIDDRYVVFCGGLLCGGGTVWNLYDFQHNYLPGPLFEEWLESLDTLLSYAPDTIYPSFGEGPGGADSITLLKLRVHNLKELMFPKRKFSHQTPVKQLLPHLYYVDQTTFLIVADNGKGFIIDYCGVEDKHLIDLSKKGILKTIDKITVSHCHYDHYSSVAELKVKCYNSMTPTTDTEVWTISEMTDVFANPHAYYDLPCVNPAVLEVDRVFTSGESVCWEGFNLTFYHHPGQTWYAMGLLAEIDGYRVLFTGDNNWPIKGDRTISPVMFKNVLPPSYIPLAEHVRELKPDFMAAGHYGLFKTSENMLESYVTWAKDIEAAFDKISAQKPSRYAIDPSFARVSPYFQKVKPGANFPVTVTVKNYHDRDVEIIVAVFGNRQIKTAPARGSAAFVFNLESHNHHNKKRMAATAEVTIDSVFYGQACEFIVETAAL